MLARAQWKGRFPSLFFLAFLKSLFIVKFNGDSVCRKLLKIKCRWGRWAFNMHYNKSNFVNYEQEKRDVLHNLLRCYEMKNELKRNIISSRISILSANSTK